jgi:hypothetical protein
VLEKAKRYQYHDFKNEKYEAPKMKLVEHLQKILTATKEDKYDN